MSSALELPVPVHRTVVFQAEYGDPCTVVDSEQRDDIRTIPRGCVLVEMRASSINPSDINVLEGKYLTLHNTLPGVLGFEGAGVVHQVGPGVSARVKPGMRCFFSHVGGFDDSETPDKTPSVLGTWSSHLIVDANAVVELPEAVPFELGAMLAVNPPTALALLTEMVALPKGAWVIQNGANSAVGACVVQFAKRLGFHTVNVVRRQEAVESLKAFGADVVVTEDTPLSKQIKSLVPAGTELLLGLNMVGGTSASEVAKCLTESGTLVTYGAMSKQPVCIGNGQLIFKDIRVVGFHLGKWARRADAQKRRELIAKVLECAGDGLVIPVSGTFTLDRAKDAVEVAMRPSKSGKTLFKCC